jgi:PQQ-like domain
MTTAWRSSRLTLPVVAILAFGLAVNSPVQLPARIALAASSGSWTAYHHDNGHTGYDSTLPNATSAIAGWTSAVLDGQVYAEPLVYNGVVYAATLNNTVYAINQATGLTIWSNHLGTPQASGWVCGNVAPMGILGTPVIDAAANRIYAVAEIAGTTPTYRLFGLDLGNNGNILLNTAIAPTGFGWKIQQERGALALANGYVYVPFGGRAGDCFDGTTPYYGWVVGVPTSGVGSPNVFQTPSGAESVWAAGGVVVDDTSHNVFFPTGNAIPCAGSTLSDAVVRVSPTLTTPTFFEPNDWQANWCGPDSDLGSASPVLISPNLMFMAGKRGGGFLLDPTNLGGVNGQLFPPRSPYSQAEVCFGTHSDATFGSFAYAAPFIYVECESNGLVALSTSTSAPSFSQCNAACAAPDWHAGGTTTFGPPIVAGGAVWVASNGGGLTGFNATTGAQIFQSAGFGINRFVTPAEAGGQVFVPSLTVIRSFNMIFSNTWTSLGGTLTSGPDPSSWGANRLDVFLRGANNGLWHTSWNGSAWSPQVSLGGVITSDPGAASWSANRIDIFARGQDNGIWHMWWNGYAWSAWYPLGGVLSSGPDVSSWSANRLDVFARGQDNGLWHMSWNGSGWSAWQSLGGVLTSDPTAVSWGPNRIDVFARGQDNGLWHLSWNGSSWSGWQALGGTLTSGPDASSCAAGHLDVFATGTGGATVQIGFNGSGWTPWLNLGNQWTSDPGAVCQPGAGAADVFERGTDNALWHGSISAS